MIHKSTKIDSYLTNLNHYLILKINILSNLVLDYILLLFLNNEFKKHKNISNKEKIISFN
jgi:hypothetical protein